MKQKGPRPHPASCAREARIHQSHATRPVAQLRRVAAAAARHISQSQSYGASLPQQHATYGQPQSYGA